VGAAETSGADGDGGTGFGARLESRLASLPRWALPAAASVAAFAVRAWTLVEERAGNPLFRVAILDDAVYLRLAEGVRTGADAARGWFLAPLYPWTLAAASAGATPDMASAERLSVLVGALTAATVAVAARRAHSSVAGWIAGAAYALAGAFVFADVLPGQEPLLCFLHAVAALLAVHWFEGGRSWTAAAFGGVVGFAVLGRPTSAALGAAFAVAALVHARARPDRRSWRAVFLAAAGCAVVLLPAAARNLSATGDFTPLPWSGGPNLYLSNGPESRRASDFRCLELGAAPDTIARRAVEIAEREESRPLRPSEVSAYWTARTWDERGDAADWTSHLARKAALFWSAAETPNNHDAAVEREWSTWLRLSPTTTWWLLALGAAGWWLARRRAPALDAAALAVLFTWAALTAYFPLSRYKLPAATLAVVLGAAGAAEILVFRVAMRRSLVAAAAIALAVRASTTTFRPVTHENGVRNVAFAFEEEGARSSAIDFLRRYLADEPDDGPALEKLGKLLVEDGRAEEGLLHLRRAAQDGRSRWKASAAAVRALVALGRAAAAEDEGAPLLSEPAPDAASRAELLADLALAAHAAGDARKAAERLAAAEATDASAPAVARARAAISR
jgi:4-amino-4-deoxy-L-arabinose transferase-like glycosyltransferase